jgi:hypothetical protein
LSVKDIQAVAFFKEVDGGHWRVSMRSKGKVAAGTRTQPGARLPAPWTSFRIDSSRCSRQLPNDLRCATCD